MIARIATIASLHRFLPVQALTGASFRPCAVCTFPRHAAQFSGPEQPACMFCSSPERFPLSHPLTAHETRRHHTEPKTERTPNHDHAR